MEINIITIVALVAGFVAGVLVTRNNFAKVNKIVSDIDQKVDEIKNSRSKPPARRGRKPKAKTSNK